MTCERFFLRYPLALVSILFSVFFSSCDRKVIFEENVKLPDNHWNINNTVILQADIKDTVIPCNIYFNIRNAGGYPFSNLFLFFNTVTPSGKTSRDTVELTLADANGKWLGEGSGDIWDNRILFKRNFHFPEAGMYRFEMQQAMRVDPLPQIMDAGIRIEKAE